ncbi:MAG: DUF5054 domain-containing protein [Microthrixaceae bacterium]
MPELVDDGITKVLVVFKTHLDVGFTDFAWAVRQRYLDEFFPRALEVSSALRRRGGSEQFRWTTGSWILHEALEAEAQAGKHELHAAVERGDLCWHALPFTLHTEYCDRSLLEHGLKISADLDKRFGIQTRAAKMTDVPGHTRALVSVLVDAGVEFLHIGVNPAATAPQVPELFTWRDRAAAGVPELRVMYQPGGYGDVQVIPGTSTAVAIDLTGDNLGPHSAEQVIERFASLSERFPNAQIHAAKLDDIADLFRTAADSETPNLLDLIPVIDQEIGDTWIYGVGSDPQKTAAFRELCRLQKSWPTQEDSALAQASTQLLLIAEHTWGMDQKTHWPDQSHWSASQLSEIKEDPALIRFESSWAEQRQYVEQFISALERNARPDHAAQARRAVQALTPVQPDSEDLEQVRQFTDTPLQLGEYQVRLNSDGSVAELRNAAGRELAGSCGLGRLSVQTYSAEDYERWFSTYNAGTTQQDLWWARWDNTKPGLEDSGALSAIWRPQISAVWQGTRHQQDLLHIHLEFPAVALMPSAPVALPQSAILSLRCPSAHNAIPGMASQVAESRPQSLEFELQWFGTPAARWPQSVSWQFAPLVLDPSLWQMVKLGELVSPADVVALGGRHLHCADRVIHPEGIQMEFVDSALVAPGKLQLLEFEPLQQAIGNQNLSDGWDLCLHNNLWGTNFAMWAPGDARFRVRLNCDAVELDEPQRMSRG